MSKSSLLKNARNYAEYLRKKERGPVKAFFHITKNENVPAIEQQGLGRQPTAEEIDNWARADVFNEIKSGDIDAPKILGNWSDKANWDITERLSEELLKRMGK